MINLNKEMLTSFAIAEGAQYIKTGAICITTGAHTGRCPTAKKIELCDETRDKIDWDNNQSITEDEFDKQCEKFRSHKDAQEIVYTQNVQAVRDWKHTMPLRVFTEKACYGLFVSNMFSPTKMSPLYEVYHFPSLTEEAQVLISFTKKIILISGTQYSGEIKKAVFTALNYHLPEKGILPMHCSVNMDKDRSNPTIFFGLSGTGKTTLSSDTGRVLIGDDEHGWSNFGLTNFEGGCYAKTIGLTKDSEPLIFEACHRPGTILENVVIKDGIPDFDDTSITENGRASYSIEAIDNSDYLGFVDRHPNNIIMLTCDAFGVLPPVSKLTPEKAVEHFLIGYTAKVAGTEAGVKEPIATFSSCFGAPFMPLKPEVYGELLKNKIKESNVNCWLVNTGWVGGAYGTGNRISLKHTRQIIDLINSNQLSEVETVNHKYTGLEIPQIETLPPELLEPEKSWASLSDYKNQVRTLITMFTAQKNKVFK